MKEIQEGRAIFKAHISGKEKGPGKIKGVFYNPSMKLSRDLHVAFAKQFNFKGKMLDGMAASGIRGIRLMLEANIEVEFCDSSKLAIKTIKENLKFNNLKAKVHHKYVEEHLKENNYDWIDIDPFGTPAPYLEAAIDAVNHNGILGIAATDTAVLCGAKPSICKKRYGAMSMKKVASKEIGIRILLGKIHTIASQFNKGIDPILCYSEGHHLRVFVKLINKNDIKLKWITTNMKIEDKEREGASGPLWLEKIIQPNFVPKETEGNLGKILETLEQEAEGPPGLHDINDIARIAGIGQTPKRMKIIKCIQNLGCFASSSIFSPLGIKTDASEKIRNEAVILAQSL